MHDIVLQAYNPNEKSLQAELLMLGRKSKDTSIKSTIERVTREVILQLGEKTLPPSFHGQLLQRHHLGHQSQELLKMK